MKHIVTFDVGHTTGVYWGVVENSQVDFLGSWALTYPLTEEQQTDVMSLLKGVQVLLIEYPVANRMSTQIKKTTEVTKWWAEFVKAPQALQLIIQPSVWKPLTKNIRDQVLPPSTKDKIYTTHERDAACMAWWWARWRSGLAK